MTRTDATWIPATIAPERIRELLTHARPEHFAAFDSLREDLDTGRWIVGPIIEHRDSDTIEQSNAAAIVATLQEHKARAWTVRRCNHWAVGWVDHLSYAVIDRKGRPTLAARIMEGIAARLDEYPVLDDDDLSEREAEDLAETLDVLGLDVAPHAPPDALLTVAYDLGYSRGDDVHTDRMRQELARRGWLGCDACQGSGYVPDPVGGPEHVTCEECDAADAWPLAPEHGTVVGPLPLLDGTCGPYVPLPE